MSLGTTRKSKKSFWQVIALILLAFNIFIGSALPITQAAPMRHEASPEYQSTDVEPPAAISLPPPWQTQNIGFVGATGSASYSNGIFTLAGSGNDIYGTSDAFRYVYQSLNGDGTIVARVASQDKTSVYAKAGVMIRETLDAGSVNAMMALTPGYGTTFQWRYVGDNNTPFTFEPAGSATAPYWIKLVRTGNIFTGYASRDGITFIQADTQTIPMTATVYIGLAVTAHNNSQLNTSTFDSVMITTPTLTPNETPTATPTGMPMTTPTETPTATPTKMSITTPAVTGTGSLMGSSSANVPEAVVNLTTEGTLDWVDFSHTGDTSVDRKSGGSQLIGYSLSSLSTIQYSSYITGFSWTNGTPDATAANTTNGIDTTNPNGFVLTVPADTATRTVRVYVAVDGTNRGDSTTGGTSVFSASLSDGSAPTYTDIHPTPGQFQRDDFVYMIIYNAASANQSLNLQFAAANSHYTVLSLQAVTLA